MIVAIVLYLTFHLLDNWLKSYQKKFSEGEPQANALSVIDSGFDLGNFGAVSALSQSSTNSEVIEGVASSVEGSEVLVESLSSMAESAVSLVEGL